MAPSLQNRKTSRLRAEVKFVRTLFFPRWDRARKWRFRIVRGLASDGQCTPRKKVICLQDLPGEETLLRVYLIHEISHAFALGHGQAWQGRMLEASKIAADHGLIPLATKLREEVKEYRKSITMVGEKVTARSAYGDLEDCVRENEIGYRQAVKHVAGEFAMAPAEFIRQFPLAKRIFEKAKRYRQRELERIRIFKQVHERTVSK
jgi:hypothetical protein